MRRIICAAVVAAILLSGCGKGASEVIDLSPEVLTEAVVMVPETVYELPDTFYAGAALVYGDRYAVCEMLTQEFAAEVYDLKEGKVVGKLLHYGNGPQEVLVPIFNMFGDTLCRNRQRDKIRCHHVVHDFVRGQSAGTQSVLF